MELSRAAAAGGRERAGIRLKFPALFATIVIHLLALLLATYVATARDEPRKPSMSAGMTIIDLNADSGAALDRLTPSLASPTPASLAAVAKVTAPPAPAAIALTPTIGQPSGSPGASSFDPYAGASPVQRADADSQTDTNMPQTQASAQREAVPLNAGMAELRTRMQRIASGLRGNILLEVLIDGEGIIRDIRVVSDSIAASVSSDVLRASLLGLKLFPADDAVAPQWRALPAVQL